MLYLFRQTDEAGPAQGHFLPVADLTAIALERALLAPDSAIAQRELTAALIADPALAAWAAFAARQHGMAPTTISEVVVWLSADLVQHSRAAVRIDASFNAVERVPKQAAAGYASAYALVKARALAQEIDESQTISDLAVSESYFSSMVAAAQGLFGKAALSAASEVIDPLGHYFIAEESGIESRLPSLLAKLADYEEQLADFDRRLEHEKLESLKELAYGASHEINNPLANIAARAQTLLAGEKDPERGRKLAAIHRQAMRAHEMIADLMLFARPPKLDPVSCDLRTIVESIVEELRDEAAQRDIQIAAEFAGESFEVTADPTQIAVAIKTLIINSLEAIGAGGHVGVAVRPVSVDDSPTWEITVVDDGPGVSEAVRRHIFDPFFSGREAGRGLGFGLSKCWRIVTDHGGQVVVHKPSRRGAEISIALPVNSKNTSKSADV